MDSKQTTIESITYTMDVDPVNGNDATGNWTLPFKTLSGVMKFLAEVDLLNNNVSIYLQPGTYIITDLLCKTPQIIFIQAAKGVDPKTVIFTNFSSSDYYDNFWLGNVTCTGDKIKQTAIFNINPFGNIYIKGYAHINPGSTMEPPSVNFIGWNGDLSDILKLSKSANNNVYNLTIHKLSSGVLDNANNCNFESADFTINTLTLLSDNSFVIGLQVQTTILKKLTIPSNFTITMNGNSMLSIDCNYPSDLKVVPLYPTTQKIIEIQSLWQCVNIKPGE